jgi:hypothetical protein
LFDISTNKKKIDSSGDSIDLVPKDLMPTKKKKKERKKKRKRKV